MSDIDLSTHQLCDQTAAACRKFASMDDVMQVWHGVGRVVRQQLEQQRGVRLEHFGSFAFDKAGIPTFVMSSEFSRKYAVSQKATPQLGGSVVQKLNLSQLADVVGIDRSSVDKIYQTFVTTLGKAIQAGRNALISVHKVAELNIANNTLKCNYTSDLLRALGVPEPGAARPKSAPRQRTMVEPAWKTFDGNVTGVRAGGQTLLATDNALKKKKKSKAPMVPGKRPLKGPGEYHNPITGEGVADDIHAGKKRFGADTPHNPILHDDTDGESEEDYGFVERRRPSTASTTSSRYSAAPSSASSPRSGWGPSPAVRARPYSGDRSAPPGRRPATPVKNGPSRRPATPVNDVSSRRPATPVNRRAVAAPAAGAARVDPRSLAASAIGPDAIVEKIRSKIVERGGSSGIHGLSRLLAIMDDSGDKKLSKDELLYGLRDYGINVTPAEMDQVFKAFDRDGNGTVDFDEFLVAIKGPLPPQRKKFVKMAFDILDTDGSGEITVDELAEKYDVSAHPGVKAGKITERQALEEFMSQWDRLDKDNLVTLEEFEDYYKGVSASIDDDTYFELMIRNAWRIAGGKGAAANTANRRVLVTNKDGSQSVVGIDNELGLKADDREGMRRRLAAQGVHAENIELYGGMDTTEKPKKGGVAPRFGNAPSARAAPVAVARGVPQRRPASRDYYPGGGDEHMPPEPMEAWGAPQRASAAPLGSGRSMSGGATAVSEPEDKLKLILYTPACSIEELAKKLQVSVVMGSTARVAQGGFISRIGVLDPKVSKKEAQAMWQQLDPRGIGSIEIGAVHRYLADRYGKDKSSSKPVSAVDRVVARIKERAGGGGIKGLQRVIAIMDDDGNKRLSKEELKTGLKDYGVELNIRELDDIFALFDRDRDGTIDVTEFLVAIKGPLNDRRKRLVKMAFDILDTDGSGEITVDELAEKYDVSAHPGVKAGKITERQALEEFMAQWDRLDKDNLVTLEEFEDYYRDISASIDGDDYFELMIRNAWRIAGGKGAAANTANRRVLVTNKDGSQSVVGIDNELGLKADDREGMRRRLAAQGVHAENIELYGGMDTTEKPKKAGNRPVPRGAPQRVGPRTDPGRGPQSFGSIGADIMKRDMRGMPSNVQSTRADRTKAAQKLISVFRGHQGRKEFQQEQRKVDARRREDEENVLEASRPKPRSISRPKGKSYIGF